MGQRKDMVDRAREERGERGTCPRDVKRDTDEETDRDSEEIEYWHV